MLQRNLPLMGLNKPHAPQYTGFLNKGLRPSGREVTPCSATQHLCLEADRSEFSNCSKMHLRDLLASPKEFSSLVGVTWPERWLLLGLIIVPQSAAARQLSNHAKPSPGSVSLNGHWALGLQGLVQGHS